MFVYWTMYAFPALFAIISGRREGRTNTLSAIGLAVIGLMFVVLIGLRYEVGADWFSYELIVSSIKYEEFGTALGFGDPGFNLIAWVLSRMGADLYGANFFCGLVLVTGLVIFCRQQEDVWLAITAAVPYLLIVVGMGYVRQGAAIGFIMIALTRFDRGDFARAFGWIGVAGLFHASAVVIAPFLGMAIVRKRPILLVPGAIVSVLLFVLLLQKRVDSFYTTYVEAEYDSSGALVRLLMNAVPALIFLVYRKRFPASEWSRVLWTFLSAVSLLLVVVVVLTPSTTIIDRVGLYLIPIQIYVFGNLAFALRTTGQARFAVIVLALGYYAAIQFVWLNFATHAEYWLPYRFAPLEG